MKYELDQVIHYVYRNRLCSAPVLARQRVDNLRTGKLETREQYQLYRPFGPNNVAYATVHGVFSESDVYESRPELMSALNHAADDYEPNDVLEVESCSQE